MLCCMAFGERSLLKCFVYEVCLLFHFDCVSGRKKQTDENRLFMSGDGNESAGWQERWCFFHPER